MFRADLLRSAAKIDGNSLWRLGVAVHSPARASAAPAESVITHDAAAMAFS